ncbi:hypothetical protein KC342_g24 [Hortaea werneckii]|nr:hypothetical protein KC342_g24 [Hortaea werneckii]
MRILQDQTFVVVLCETETLVGERRLFRLCRCLIFAWTVGLMVAADPDKQTPCSCCALPVALEHASMEDGGDVVGVSPFG